MHTNSCPTIPAPRSDEEQAVRVFFQTRSYEASWNHLAQARAAKAAAAKAGAQ